MAKYDFLLAFLKNCCLKELEELKEIICQEIVSRQKVTVKLKLETDQSDLVSEAPSS